MALVETARRQLTLATHRIHTLPIVVLMAHSACNCRCLMCDIWKANQSRQELSREDLVSQMHVFRAFDVQWVLLTGGEALMHSNLWTLCELLREAGVQRISLASTGLLVKRHAESIAAHCDDLIVSIDGSRELHDRIRNVPRAWDRMAEGVAALRKLAPALRITGRCAIHRENYRDLPNIVRAAHELGLDQVSFLAVDVSTTAFNRPQPWEPERASELSLTRDEVRDFERVLEQTIERCADDFASGFIAESQAKLRRLVQYFAALNGDADFPANRCNAPWVSTVVEADGRVRPCFFHREIGNIRQNPLDQVLNSPEAVDFRRNLDVRTDPICRKCVVTLYLGPRAPVGSP